MTPIDRRIFLVFNIDWRTLIVCICLCSLHADKCLHFQWQNIRFSTSAFCYRSLQQSVAYDLGSAWFLVRIKYWYFYSSYSPLLVFVSRQRVIWVQKFKCFSAFGPFERSNFSHFRFRIPFRITKIISNCCRLEIFVEQSNLPTHNYTRTHSHLNTL